MKEFNNAKPLIMHVDLNSCFASVEQQARPLLRGRPVAIVNRRTEHTAIVTASYEAKAKGVKVGMKIREAKLLCPDIVALESDPDKYKYVYRKLLSIMNDYSAKVDMKSIDEGVIDFSNASPSIVSRGLENIGLEIKQRLKDEVGVWMRCNIGISTNRFLAKTAAGLHKPDGLDVITSQNIRSVFSSLELTDLTGIAKRNQARLNSVGIYTPIEFLDSNVVTLRDIVFKSVVGEWWYKRMRGWEVDDVQTEMRRVGRQYVLDRFDLSYEDILKRLHNLCESVGFRMRLQGKSGRGVYVYAKTHNRKYWHSSHVSRSVFSSDTEIYNIAKELFTNAPDEIREIGVHCYLLEDIDSDVQVSLFQVEVDRHRLLYDAIDSINKGFGDRTIHSADTLETRNMLAKIPFGSTRHL